MYFIRPIISHILPHFVLLSHYFSSHILVNWILVHAHDVSSSCPCPACFARCITVGTLKQCFLANLVNDRYSPKTQNLKTIPVTCYYGANSRDIVLYAMRSDRKYDALLARKYPV